MDVVLVYDTSGSIDSEERKLVKEALVNFASQMNISKDGTHFAAVSFSNIATAEFFFDTYEDEAETLEAITDLPFRRGATNLANALQVTRETVLTRNNRPEVPDVVIIFTDGKPNKDVDQTSSQAAKLKEVADMVYTVGITPAIGQDLLQEVATSNQHALHLWEFTDLTDAATELVSQLCTPNPVIEGELIKIN